jgi:hypothetical protein
MNQELPKDLMLGPKSSAAHSLTGNTSLPFRGNGAAKQVGDEGASRRVGATTGRLHLDDAALDCDRDRVRAIIGS